MKTRKADLCTNRGLNRDADGLVTAQSRLQIPMLRVDPNGIIQWANDAWIGLTGAPMPKGRGLRLSRFVAAADSRALSDLIARTQRLQQAETCCLSIVRRDGAVRETELHASPMRPGVLLAAIDLTDRMQRLAFALASAEQGIWDWDVPSGRVLYARPGGTGGPEELHWSEQQAGKWYEQAHPHDTALAKEQVQRVLDGKADRFLTVVRMRLSAREPWRHIESRGKVIAKDHEGHALRLVGVYRDVTEALKQERESRCRDSDLAYASRIFSMEELASSLAHELNQPLGALSNFVQAAQRFLDCRKPDLAGAKAAMRKAVAVANRPAEIIRGLRGLVQRAAPRSHPVDLRRLLQDTIFSVAHRAEATGIKIDMHAPQGLVKVNVDRVQIEQVLLNLINNSMDAMQLVKRGDRDIRIAAIVNEGRLSVSVSDNGRGVAPEATSRLFKPFFTTKPAGMGLGLAISRSIIESHGGRLWLAANGPAGATMCFEIPLGKATHEKQEESKSRRIPRRGRR